MTWSCDLVMRLSVLSPSLKCTGPLLQYLADSAVAEVVRSVQGGGARGVASNVEALHHFDDYFRASYQPSLVRRNVVTLARKLYYCSVLSTCVQSHEQRSKLVLRAKVAYSADDNPAKYHEQVNSGSPPGKGWCLAC